MRVFADALNGSVYHFRDKTDLECDAVIHLRNGAYWYWRLCLSKKGRGICCSDLLSEGLILRNMVRNKYNTLADTNYKETEAA